jgi:hypothetical protein
MQQLIREPMLLSTHGRNLLSLGIVNVDQVVPFNAHGAACEAHQTLVRLGAFSANHTELLALPVVDVDRISTGDYCSDFFVHGYWGWVLFGGGVMGWLFCGLKASVYGICGVIYSPSISLG